MEDEKTASTQGGKDTNVPAHGIYCETCERVIYPVPVEDVDLEPLGFTLDDFEEGDLLYLHDQIPHDEDYETHTVQ